LAYLLYHHFDDFFTQTASDNENKNTIPASMLNYNTIMHPQVDDNKNHAGIRILELGTGMAGLSALALGFRLARQQQERGGKMSEDNTNENENRRVKKKKHIYVTLTDGNPSGVKNNIVNQYLTKLNSQMWQQKGNYSHYLDLDVQCETLVWTTDLDSGKDSLIDQDVVLVSDCVHFQNFHAALATTTLRCLRVGAIAIFCQPTRGPSLDNFFNLLLTATSDTDTIGSTSLLSCIWLSHPIIEQKHQEARLHYNNVYDENLHQPKILVVTKLREMSKEDQMRFVAYQHRYSPIVPTTIEEM
jgi:predicted nicotinamide N-methyase